MAARSEIDRIVVTAAATWAMWSGALVVAHAGVPDPTALAARVAGEPIYLYEVVQAASSLALVGKEGAGERIGTRERILERLVTARLLYLDALDRGLDRTPPYREALARSTHPILAARYLEARRPRAYDLPGAGRRASPDEETAALRAQELARLEPATPISVLADHLAPDGDECRDPLAPVARVGDDTVTWSRVRDRVGQIRGVEERRRIVRHLAEDQLLAAEATRLGLAADPGFEKLAVGFRRRELVRLAREEIGNRPPLDTEALRRAYERNLDRFTFPEQRRVQQIVVRTRTEAEQIAALLDDPPAGVTFHTLARDRSIDPRASRTLGILGWVTRSQGHPALTETAFALEPGERSAPIRTEAGFHLIRVLDRRPREVAPFDDDTQARIRARLQADRVEEYARRLAEERYTVELFPEVYRLPKGSSPSQG